MKPLLAIWNLSYYSWDGHFRGSRRAWQCYCVHRAIRERMRCNPKGGGHRAWKRYDAMMRDPRYLIWPDYALS